jgi:hypothetical protein
VATAHRQAPECHAATRNVVGCCTGCSTQLAGLLGNAPLTHPPPIRARRVSWFMVLLVGTAVAAAGNGCGAPAALSLAPPRTRGVACAPCVVHSRVYVNTRAGNTPNTPQTSGRLPRGLGPNRPQTRCHRRHSGARHPKQRHVTSAAATHFCPTGRTTGDAAARAAHTPPSHPPLSSAPAKTSLKR